MIYFSASTCGFYDSDIHGDRIPADAVEITREEHAALLAGQSADKRIAAGADGRPKLQDAPKVTGDQLAAQARSKREAMLSDSDWVTLRAVETGEPVPAEWATYRQALRDLPKQKAFPKSITWPAAPR